MAALSATNPTLLDVTKAQDPEGKIAAVAEILTQVSEILPDMTWMEGNLKTGHRGSIRAGIPEPTFRKYNAGTQPTKGQNATVTANTAMMEDYSEIDKSLADLANNAQAYRLSQDKAKIQGFNNKAARYLFFGNEGSEPEAFTGLGLHYNSLTAANADNVISGGGTGSDNGSIWLVVWSPETVFGIYPQGSVAGLQVNDKGQVTIENADGAGGRMEAYRTHYKWDLGLFLHDWRYVVRIPNIDKSNLSTVYTAGAFAAGSANLPDLMYQAMEQVPDLSSGRAAFYMSRTMRSMLRRQLAAATQSSTLTTENVGGNMVTKFQGIPLRRVDALAADETRIV